MPKLTDWMRERAVQSTTAPAARPLQHAWYKVNGMTVDVDGRGLPPPCARCRGISEFLCDYPATEGVTCNAPLCPDCAKPVGKNQHLCPIHAKKVLTDSGPLL